MKYWADTVSKMPRAIAWLKRNPEWVRFFVLTLLVAAQAYLPIRLLLATLQWVPGVIEGPDSIHLGLLGYIVLGFLALLTCVQSVAIGAFHRVVIPSLTGPSAIASYLIGATGFVASGLVLQPIAGAVGKVDKGDGGLILMFVALWIATMGYIAKVAWDDLRDRLVRILEPVSVKPPPTCCGRPPKAPDNEATPPEGGAGL